MVAVLANMSALLGAGVSVDAGLPTAYALIDEVIDALVHREWAREELKRLARPGRADMKDSHDTLRFEGLLLWVGDVFDEARGLFDFLDDYKQPGDLHLRFAQVALDGATVLTTNFDDLLERAILDLGGVPKTVDAHARADVLVDVPVIKLHGTRAVHRSGRVYAARRPLHATTEVIAASNPGNLLNDAAASVLRSGIDGRDLVVAGYSASDDLDITPVLLGAKPSSVQWVDYSGGALMRLTLDDLATEEASWLDLLRAWNAGGAQVTIWRGPASEAVQALGLSLPHAPSVAEPVVSWRTSVRSWARTVRWHDPTGLGLAGLLFGEMRRFDLAESALRESRGSRRSSDAGWTSARRRYELAQNELLRQGSDPRDVARLASRARREALRSGDHRTALFALLLLGRAFFLQQEWDRAASTFEKALIDAESGAHRAYAQSWLGRSLAWSGRPEEAISPLRAAIRTMRREGQYEGLIDALDGLGLAYHLRGHLVRSRQCYEEAERAAELYGFVDLRFTLLVSLASVAMTGGDLDVAAERLAQSFSLGEDGSDEAAIAWAISADLHVARGRYSEALADVKRAIDAITVITRDEAASLHALAAELHARLGDAERAREEAWLAQPVGTRGPLVVSTIHALCVFAFVGDVTQNEVRAAISRRSPNLVVPSALRLAEMLDRFNFEDEARRVRRSARHPRVVASAPALPQTR